MAKPSKALKAVIFYGLCYLIVGVMFLFFKEPIADLFNAKDQYIFITGMILILIGIKDVTIMPLFLNNKDAQAEEKIKND